MNRVQLSLDDETKALLDSRSKERGVSPAALVTLLLHETGASQPGMVAGDGSSAAQQVLSIMAARCDQLHQTMDDLYTTYQALEAKVQSIQHRHGALEEDLQRQAVALGYAIEQLEPMVGISLRPGVQFHAEIIPQPKRPWWDWRA